MALSDREARQFTSHTESMSNTRDTTKNLLISLIAYTLLRVGAFVGITIAIVLVGTYIIGTEVPLVVAMLFAVILMVPLSLILGRSIRNNVVLLLQRKDIGHRQQKDQLRAELRKQLHNDVTRNDITRNDITSFTP